MHVVRITVIHALGTFHGTIELKPEDATFDNAKDLVDGLQVEANRLNRLAITLSDGSEASFNEKILGESILIFKIEEIDE